MSMSVSRESISKLMTELVDSFPMEPEGRASISDFGKLLFAEGQASRPSASVSAAASASASALTPRSGSSSGSDQDAAAAASTPAQSGSKRVFTEIKGVPRQKQHDVRTLGERRELLVEGGSRAIVRRS